MTTSIKGAGAALCKHPAPFNILSHADAGHVRRIVFMVDTIFRTGKVIANKQGREKNLRKNLTLHEGK